MELADIKRQAQAAREFEHSAGGFVFSLRLPTDFEVACAAAAATGRISEATVRTQRTITELSVIGWRGIAVRDILGEHKHGDDEFAFEVDAVPLLLDQRSDLARDLWLQALLPRLEARNHAKEATAKNSPRASPGAKASPMRASSRQQAD